MYNKYELPIQLPGVCFWGPFGRRKIRVERFFVGERSVVRSWVSKSECEEVLVAIVIS